MIKLICHFGNIMYRDCCCDIVLINIRDFAVRKKSAKRILFEIKHFTIVIDGHKDCKALGFMIKSHNFKFVGLVLIFLIQRYRITNTDSIFIRKRCRDVNLVLFQRIQLFDLYILTVFFNSIYRNLLIQCIALFLQRSHVEFFCLFVIRCDQIVVFILV